MLRTFFLVMESELVSSLLLGGTKELQDGHLSGVPSYGVVRV